MVGLLGHTHAAKQLVGRVDQLFIAAGQILHNVLFEIFQPQTMAFSANSFSATGFLVWPMM